MSTARRLSTNPAAVTAWPGRAAVALALSVATLATMPAAAEAQGDITVRFARSAESVHEGDPLGLSLQFSEIPDRVIPAGQWYVEIPLIRTNVRGARNGVDYHSNTTVKVYRNRGYHWAGFAFGAHEDDDVDPGESVVFEFGTLPAGFVAGEPMTLEVTILDGPSPPPVSTMVTLSVSPDSVSEDAGSTRVTVTGSLNSVARDSDTTVMVSVESGTAIAGTDFSTVSDFPLTIPANETRGTATFNLVPTNDDVDESDETLTVSGSTTGLAVDSETMTITDDDTAGVTVTPTGLTVTEGSSQSYTVRLTSQPTGNVTVTVGGASGDVSVDDPMLTFTTTTWSNPQSVTVRAADDDDAVTDAQVTLTHTVSGGGYNGVTASDVTVDITENDTASTKVILSVEPATVNEDDGTTRITVTGTLDGAALTTSTSVDVSVGAGADSATAGTDFATVTSFDLTIDANAMKGSATFDLVPTDDEVAEGAETVEVSGTTTDLSVDPATLTITDDDATPTKVILSVEPATVNEDDGSTQVTVTGTLDGAALTTNTVVEVSVGGGGSATAGTDFATVTSFDLTIDANAMKGSATFDLVPTDDEVAEGAETVEVSGTTTDLSVDPATLTITDDDATPTKVILSVEPATVNEDDGSTQVTVTGTLDGAALTTNTVVEVSVGGGGSATAGTDFATVTSFDLTIDANAMKGSATFDLVPTDDEVAEGAETVEVSGTTTDLSVDPATLTITDDDATPTKVILSVEPATVNEDDGSTQVTVTGTLDGAALTTNTVVEVSVGGGGSATAGTDFATVTSFDLTIDANAMKGSATFDLVPTDDEVAEGAETVEVSGTTTDLSVDPATLTITDDDATPTKVILSVEPATVNEDDGSTQVTVTGTLDGAALTTNTVVEVSVGGGGSATAGTDFATVTSFDLTIDANAMKGSATFDLVPTDDEVAEGAETVEVSGTTTDLSVDPATLTITDDDATPTKVILSVEPATVNEDDGSTQVTVTGTLDGAALTTNTVVEVSVGGGGSATAGTDFATVTSFDLTIDANAMKGSATFDLVPTDDGLAEGAETVEVSGTTTDLNVDPATLTIIDDDAPGAQQRVKLSMDGDSEWVMEGAGPTDVTVKAELTGETRDAQTRVDVELHPHEASANDFDAETESFPILIPANQKSATHTFRFTPTDDAEEESDENLMFTGDTGALDIPVDPTTLMIKDNDGPSSGITLSVRPREVVEDAGPARVRVTARLDDGPRPSATTVQVTVDEDEDNYGLTPAVFDVEIPEGATSAMGTFILRPVADTKDERDQRVAITGTTSTEGLGVSATGLTIKDDDEANRPPTFGTQRYAFNLQEKQDGREQPIVLGAVSARDPDGEQVRYSLVAGDAARFTVASGSGDVAYVGPGEDFETGPRQYELTVQARDDHDGKRPSAQVVVTVTDVPEAPVAADDAAETAEDEPVVIDVLANDSDPDGDSLRLVALTAPAHGTTTLSEGGVRYEPAPNYHGSDEFRYTVADPGGLSATATVTLTVTPVNDPPDAVDDEAETLEDEPVVVDVLANDTDVDGDLLRIVSATAPAHGTATARAGGVRYAPALNYHGQDSFDYTIADPGGLTDTATVTVTVLPVNDAPEAVGVIPDQPLEEGGEPVTLDIAPYFTDVDGDVLTYAAESSNPAAAAASLSGSALTLSAVVRGAATVTVTATDPDGLTATQVFGVSVGDRLVREVLTDTLAALGRGHLSSVRQTVGRRLESGVADARRLTVAGQAFGPEAWDRVGSGSLSQTHELLFRAATLQQRATATDMVGTSADPRLRQPGSFTSFGGFSGDWDRALPATDVLMAFGGGDASAEEPTGGGPRWTVWGQGDLQTFRGRPEPVKGYEGDLRTGYLGVDAQVTRHWLLGVAMARSGGSGTWQRGASAGELSTTLTRVHPYVRWADGDTAVWGVLGAGRGTATHVRTLTGLGESSPLSLGLGLLEGRRRVATVGRGFEIGVRGEASWARLETGGGDETIDDLDAGVRRVRGGVEVTRALSGPGGLTLTPFGAVSTRHDGGAGQTGVGLEVAGGLRLRGGRLQLEAQGRRLVLHSATAYEEQGVSLAATVGSSPYEPGLTLSLRPTWGASGMGAETLWRDQIQTYIPGSAYDQTGVDARLGYGLRLGREGLLTPFTSFGQRQHSGRRLQVGTQVGTLGQGPGSLHGPFQIEISGERYDRPGGNPDHRFSMFGVLDLGGSALARGTATGIDPRLHEPASDSVDLAALQDAELPVSATDVTPIHETEAPTLVNAVVAGEVTPAAVLKPAAFAETATNAAAAMQAAPSRTMSSETVPAEADRFMADVVAGTTARDPASEAPAPVTETRAARSSRSGPRSNRPPVFSAPSYAFETPSRWRSRGKLEPLGGVLARDPDRGPVTYSLTAGDWTRFEVDAASGAITYLGPDLPGTRRYKLQVTARDTGRLTETVTVVVTVVASGPGVPRSGTTGAAGATKSAAPHAAGVRVATGEPRTAAALPASVVRSIAAARARAAQRAVSARCPASSAPRGPTARAAGAGRRTALADAARTYAGVPVLIDVLENDAEREGMRIVDVTTPAHGTATITNGVVRYAPAPGHRGRDTFTYTVVGEGGRTARASVTVMVVG